MRVYKDQAIVLRTMRYGESDRIVTLLTQATGKLRAIVKGVRKTKSRFGARLEPFSHVDLLLYRGRGELQIVSQAELITSFSKIAASYDAYTSAQVMCEAVDKVAPDEEPNVRLVLLLLAGLRAVDDYVGTGRPVPHVLRSAFLLKLLGISGFGPGLRCCAHCGGREGLSAFSLADGGVVCGVCRGSTDVQIASDSVALLQHMWRTPLQDLSDVRSDEVDVLVQRAIEYHLERRLRSLEVYPV